MFTLIHRCEDASVKNICVALTKCCGMLGMPRNDLSVFSDLQLTILYHVLLAVCCQTIFIKPYKTSLMTSSNGNIFRVTGPLCGELTGHRWIPLTKASDVELWCFLWSAPGINGWVNNREAGDLKRHRAHYDVIVVSQELCIRFALTTMSPSSNPEVVWQYEQINKTKHNGVHILWDILDLSPHYGCT